MDAKRIDGDGQGPGTMTRRIDVEVVQGRGRAAHGTVRGHALAVDVPVESGGGDTGPTPLETFAFALGACFVSAASAIAAMEGVEVSGISARVRGILDLRRAMGVTDQGRSGFPELVLEVGCRGPMSDREKAAFMDRVLQRCPVCDTIRLATPLRLSTASRP